MDLKSNKTLQDYKVKMEIEAKKAERKNRIKRIRKSNSKAKVYNFGRGKNGEILTSTSNPKAHTMNKLMRRIMHERDANFALMKAEYDKIVNKHDRLSKNEMFEQLVNVPLQQTISVLFGTEVKGKFIA